MCSILSGEVPILDKHKLPKCVGPHTFLRCTNKISNLRTLIYSFHDGGPKFYG